MGRNGENICEPHIEYVTHTHDGDSVATTRPGNRLKVGLTTSFSKEETQMSKYVTRCPKLMSSLIREGEAQVPTR